jgi:hypothetical protein
MSEPRIFRYRGYTALDIRLRQLEGAISNDTYSRVFGSLSEGIQAAASRIDEVERDAPEETARMVVEDECDVIESLLGAAYVVCQVPITDVTQRTLRICQLMSESSRPFARKTDVRALGRQFDAEFSQVEVLWALGNYFKHREEWDRAEWKELKLKRPEKDTIPVLEAIGLQESSSGNLRRGAEALGNAGFTELSVFEDIIRQWASEVRETIVKAVRG